MLNQWGWTKGDLWAELPNDSNGVGVLTLFGEKVLEAQVQDQQLSVNFGDAWHEYLLDDEAHPEFKDLFNECTSRVQKGIGKGKRKNGKPVL